ncbi:MAG: YdeI/OmpD-associated family protein [Pseudomonadota bacterium]
MFFDYTFEGPIVKHSIGKKRQVHYRVLFLPRELIKQLPFDTYSRVRIDGEIGDVPVHGAWVPSGDRRYYFMVSPKVMKTAGLSLSDTVEMRFSVADQNYVDLPESLADWLATNTDAQTAWQQLTPGKQRALAHHVANAKRADTQARRLADVGAALTLHKGDLRTMLRARK